MAPTGQALTHNPHPVHCGRVNPRQEVRGVNRAQAAETLCGDHGLAAAAAAVADERHMFANVLAELHELQVPRLLEQIEPFRRRRRAWRSRA